MQEQEEEKKGKREREMEELQETGGRDEVKGERVEEWWTSEAKVRCKSERLTSHSIISGPIIVCKYGSNTSLV